MSAKIFLVEGMKCKNCVAHVEKGIRALEGVEGVVADYVTGRVTVTGNPMNEELIKLAVEKAGYRFQGPAKSGAPGSDLWLS
jgi:copper chaperone CopZ